MAIASRRGDAQPLDAPLDTVLDLWYAALGEAVVELSPDSLGLERRDDWLMDNIRRIALRLDGSGGVLFSTSDAPYEVHWCLDSVRWVVVLRLKYKEK